MIISAGVLSGMIGYNKGVIAANEKQSDSLHAAYIDAIEDYLKARSMYSAKLDSLIEIYEQN